MGTLSIDRKPEGIYNRSHKTVQTTPQPGKTATEYKVKPAYLTRQNDNQKAADKTPWQNMTKRQRKNRKRINRLVELWPELFSREKPKPLKVGSIRRADTGYRHQRTGVWRWYITRGSGVLCAVSALLSCVNGRWRPLRPEGAAVRGGDATGAERG